MNRDHVVFTICGFLLGLVIGSFVLGPKLAQSKLAGNHGADESVGQAAPPAASMPAADATSAGMAGGMPAGSPMAAVRERLDSLKKKIADDPRDFDSLVELANMYMDVGKFPQAIDYYDKALAVREEPQVRTDLGICLKQSGQLDKAIAEFQRVAGEAPAQWQARFNLAIAYVDARRLGDARAEVAELKKMAGVDPAELAKLEQAAEGGR